MAAPPQPETMVKAEPQAIYRKVCPLNEDGAALYPISYVLYYACLKNHWSCASHNVNS